MTSLTARQMQALRAIRRFTFSRGYPPTVRELGAMLGISAPSTTFGILSSLQQKGVVNRMSYSPRSLTLTEEGKAALSRWETRAAR